MKAKILTINAFVAEGVYQFVSEGNALGFKVGSAWRFKKKELVRG